MNLIPMSFKEYAWPCNPQSIQIERVRNAPEYTVPQSTGVVLDAGFAAKKVTGAGRFTGPDCEDRFSELTAVFLSGGSGTLRLPGMEPFQAVFSSLVRTGEAKPGCVGYAFVFLEDAAETPEPSGVPQVYRCKGGETLWDVAGRYGIGVNELLAENPQIRLPNDLEAGEEVTIP
jgi:LysM repeat protein